MLSRKYCLCIGAVFGILLAIPATQLFDRRAPVLLGQGRIEPFDVHVGQTVTVTWPVVEYKLCEGEYTRHVKDRSNRIVFFERLPTSYSDTISRDQKWFVKYWTVPRGLVEGPAIYWTDGFRWCNPLQRYFWPIPFRAPDIPFNILPD